MLRPLPSGLVSGAPNRHSADVNNLEAPFIEYAHFIGIFKPLQDGLPAWFPRFSLAPDRRPDFLQFGGASLQQTQPQKFEFANAGAVYWRLRAESYFVSCTNARFIGWVGMALNDLPASSSC